MTLFLAHERAKGEESFYSVYVKSLPEEPPCAWCMSDEQLIGAISRYGALLDTRGWAAEVSRAKEYVEKVSTGMAKDYGEVFGVTPDDLRWAMGIVSSRAMGGAASPTLVPLLDLVNHNAMRHPFTGHDGYADAIRKRSDIGEMGEMSISDAQSSATDDWAFWSYDKSGATAVPLQGGEELLACYTDEYSPLDWFLNLGFLPIDALPDTEMIADSEPTPP